MSAAEVGSNNPWKTLTQKSPFFDWIDVSLRGSGQVIYMDNPLTGLLNFVALFWGAYAEGIPAVAWGSLVATFLGTAVAYAIPGINRGNLKAGLYGFNGMLLGAGLPTFLGSTPLMWAILAFTSVVVVFVMITVAEFMSKFKVPAFTFPFTVTLWIVMLASYKWMHVSITGLGHSALSAQVGGSTAALSGMDLINGSLNGVSEVYFITNPISGVIFLLALIVESRWCTALTLFGACVGVAVGILMGADSKAIVDGMWGYSAALTAPALGRIFLKPSAKVLVYMALGTIWCVFVQAGAYTFFGTLGIPTFTFPFQLASWMFLIGIYSLADKEVQAA